MSPLLPPPVICEQPVINANKSATTIDNPDQRLIRLPPGFGRPSVAPSRARCQASCQERVVCPPWQYLWTVARIITDRKSRQLTPPRYSRSRPHGPVELNGISVISSPRASASRTSVFGYYRGR